MRARPRWITVGEAKTGWYVRLRNCGFPDGIQVNWRGRREAFQPCEFLGWRGVKSVMDLILLRAGLMGIDWALGRERNGARRIRVRVVRTKGWGKEHEKPE